MTDNKKTISINSRAQWRQWLEKNHQIEQSVWVLCNTQKSGLPAVPWSDMVDEALCFGWIDSTRRSVDANSFVQLYSRRKAKSTWSKINKEKIDRLEMEGLMSEAGWAAVHRAKNDGSWNILDTVEALSIPT